ncbi:MAG: hypothetical protein HY725_04280, partial [Candidatus Rokubacteria bacterium]|nr:hypothetical protein [Candidatus Rokubacteria bacterium]
QKDNVLGKKQDPAGSGSGDNTIAPSTALTSTQIQKFVDAVKPYADISLNASSTQQLSYQNLGDSCSTDWNSSNCWGTQATPKVVYVKGTVDPAQQFYALTVTGTSTGAGILIIEDGDMSIAGNFRWEGLILITGQYTGLRYGGGGNQKVYGGVVVNETAAINTQVEVDASGNAQVYYSCQALSNAMNKNRKLLSLRSWKEL